MSDLIQQMADRMAPATRPPDRSPRPRWPSRAAVRVTLAVSMALVTLAWWGYVLITILVGPER